MIATSFSQTNWTKNKAEKGQNNKAYIQPTSLTQPRRILDRLDAYQTPKSRGHHALLISHTA
jgi:hypothetical protein